MISSNCVAVSDTNLALESSTLLLPNKSDSGVEGAASSLDTPLSLLPTPDKEDNYSNNNNNTHSNNMIYTNNSQANSLSNTYTSSSSPKYNNPNPNKSPRGKHYNNNNNRGGINRRGSFNRRWRGPGYSSDYQPSPITENNSSPGRGSEYNTRYKHTCKVSVNNGFMKKTKIMKKFFSM